MTKWKYIFQYVLLNFHVNMKDKYETELVIAPSHSYKHSLKDVCKKNKKKDNRKKQGTILNNLKSKENKHPLKS